jgi:hypothetical protein
VHGAPVENLRKGPYAYGYLNGCQPTPSIGLGMYGVVLAGARAGGAGALTAGFALAALFALTGGFTGFFAVGFLAAGFFTLFFAMLFFFAGFAMPRNLPHAPIPVKRSAPTPFDQ